MKECVCLEENATPWLWIYHRKQQLLFRLRNWEVTNSGWRTGEEGGRKLTELTRGCLCASLPRVEAVLAPLAIGWHSFCHMKWHLPAPPGHKNQVRLSLVSSDPGCRRRQPQICPRRPRRSTKFPRDHPGKIGKYSQLILSIFNSRGFWEEIFTMKFELLWSLTKVKKISIE